MKSQSETIRELEKYIIRQDLETKEKLANKDRNYKRVIEMMKEQYKTKVTKKKAMDVSVAVSLELQLIQASLTNFTGHNMDFRSETDWSRFLMRYIDMEGILLIDPAWPAPTNCNYKSMTLK